MAVDCLADISREEIMQWPEGPLLLFVADRIPESIPWIEMDLNHGDMDGAIIISIENANSEGLKIPDDMMRRAIYESHEIDPDNMILFEDVMKANKALPDPKPEIKAES